MSRPVSNEHDDPERDAWLSQALRHAPDASSDAPPALSDTILRESRAAVTRPRVPVPIPVPRRESPPRWLVSAWSWLARPPVAAGFASVMMATLVGIMWRDRPLNESLPRSPDLVASTPQAPAETAPAIAAASNEPVAQTARVVETAKAAAPVEPSAQQKSRDTARVAAPPRASQGKTDAAPYRTPPTLIGEPARARTDAEAAPAVIARVASEATVAETQPAPAPQAAIAVANEAPIAQRREQAAPALRAGATPSAEATFDKASPLRNESRAAPSSSGQMLAKTRAADTGSAPLAELLASVTQQPERWTWRRGNGNAQPMNPALQRWLAEFEQSTASRWRTAVENAPRDATRELRLLRDGVLQATLGFAGSGVWVEPGGAQAPAASMALLPHTTTEALKKALDEAAP